MRLLLLRDDGAGWCLAAVFFSTPDFDLVSLVRVSTAER